MLVNYFKMKQQQHDIKCKENSGKKPRVPQPSMIQSDAPTTEPPETPR